MRPDLVGITLTGQLVCSGKVSVKDGISPGGPLSLGLEVVVEQKMHLFCVFLYGLEIIGFCVFVCYRKT